MQIAVSKVGADLVTITVLDPDYPAELLKAQSEAIGRNTGSGARGIRVFQEGTGSGSSAGALWKSTFAVDGIVDLPHRLFKLQPIVAALAGAPSPHTLTQFYVDFDQLPTGPETLDGFSSSAVRVGRVVEPGTVQYAVELSSQDPARISIPGAKETVAKSPSAPVRQVAAGTDWVVLAASVLAALAAAALVYSLLLVMLRPPGKRRPRA